MRIGDTNLVETASPLLTPLSSQISRWWLERPREAVIVVRPPVVAEVLAEVLVARASVYVVRVVRVVVDSSPAQAEFPMAGRLSDAKQVELGVDSYDALGATTTKSNSTLFIAFGQGNKIPAAERASVAESIFSLSPGYVGVRQVRSMCFVDFIDIKSATSAMVRHQGQEGMTIDYDKDTGVAGKRKRERDEDTRRGAHEAQSMSCYCDACGTKALTTNGVLLSAMPTRSSGDRVVDEATALTVLLLVPIPEAQPALVRRAKGTERQYRLGCRSCGRFIAYRSAPPQQAGGKYLYVDASAIRDRPPTSREQVARSSLEQRRADEVRPD